MTLETRSEAWHFSTARPRCFHALFAAIHFLRVPIPVVGGRDRFKGNSCVCAEPHRAIRLRGFAPDASLTTAGRIPGNQPFNSDFRSSLLACLSIGLLASWLFVVEPGLWFAWRCESHSVAHAPFKLGKRYVRRETTAFLRSLCLSKNRGYAFFSASNATPSSFVIASAGRRPAFCARLPRCPPSLTGRVPQQLQGDFLSVTFF